MHDKGTSAERRYKRSNRRSPTSNNHRRHHAAVVKYREREREREQRHHHYKRREEHESYSSSQVSTHTSLVVLVSRSQLFTRRADLEGYFEGRGDVGANTSIFGISVALSGVLGHDGGDVSMPAGQRGRGSVQAAGTQETSIAG